MLKHEQGENRHFGALSNMRASVDLATEADTQNCARVLAPALQAPLVLGFEGQLGAGKTYLIREILRALGVMIPIKSPTFSYVESYALPHYTLHHFDLYRISGDVGLDGFRDYFAPDTVCCIEWPSRLPRLAPYLDALFVFDLVDNARRLSGNAFSAAGESLLAVLQDKGGFA